MSQTQIKLNFITHYISQLQNEPIFEGIDNIYISQLQNEPIFEGIDNIVDELLTKIDPYPPTKKTLLLLALQPFFVVTMNTYSSAIILGVILMYQIYPYPKYLHFSEFNSKYLTSVCVIHSLLKIMFEYLLHCLLHHDEYISIEYITDTKISPAESIFIQLNIICLFV